MRLRGTPMTDDDTRPSFLSGGGLPRIEYAQLPPLIVDVLEIRKTREKRPYGVARIPAKRIQPRACAKPGCGKVFKPDRDKVLHCSHECSRLTKAQDWRKCLGGSCGKTFYPRRPGQSFCSLDCSSVPGAMTPKRKERYDRIQPRKCTGPGCSTEFRPAAGKRSSRFCSQPCSGNSRKKPRATKVCKCGNVFAPFNYRSRVCSLKCRNAEQRKLDAAAIELARRMVAAGASNAFAARQLGVSDKTVIRALRKVA